MYWDQSEGGERSLVTLEQIAGPQLARQGSSLRAKSRSQNLWIWVGGKQIITTTSSAEVGPRE